MGPDGSVTTNLVEPFRTLVEAGMAMEVRSDHDIIRGTEVLTDFFSVISNRLQNFFGNGLNNAFMVDDMGIEPTTSALRTLRSPS